ncbi:MAG: hypothetical protein IPK52_21150 [Chloroflexi bacterium]|nr:hypothetical protein [Chloroflexota bacterium]
MKLVIVETPAQAKILADHLGEGWRVEPCYGFIRDLPPNTLGVEPDHDFRPTFNISLGKGGSAVRLKQALREADAIYAATSPGIDGEAMAWHALALEPSVTEKKKPVYRLMLDALTRDVIRDAFASPLPLNMCRIHAALTARIADRLAGYAVNAAASKALGIETRLTYGGMVALRHLANREASASRTCWQSAVRFSLGDGSFEAKILNAKGRPLALSSELQIEQLKRMLDHSHYWVEKLGGTTRSLPAPNPLTLTTLIEVAGHELNLPAERALSLVSTLYEAGQITHPDGIMLPEASEAAQEHIKREFGDAYLASTPPTANGIAPADVNRLPESSTGDGAALYRLIWRYFVAAHMAPAQERISAARIRVGPAQDKPYPVTLLAQSSQIAFDGWMRVFNSRKPDEAAVWLPLLKEGQAFRSAQAELVLDQRQMAERLSQTSLATTLMQCGFSAQTAIESAALLQTNGLIAAADGALSLTDAGLRIAAFLKETFGELTDPAYAVEFFTGVEAISVGEQTRAGLLAGFWSRCMANKPAEEEEAPPRKPVMLHALEEA